MLLLLTMPSKKIRASGIARRTVILSAPVLGRRARAHTYERP
jgi:hypothetical protein